MYKYNILVVDDDISVLENAEILLKPTYEVFLANSGDDAIKILKKQRVDLILLDILMPGMDGYATMESIKLIHECNTVPIIFLTGASEPEFELKALKGGAKDFISKPFNPSVFLARIELCLLSENVIVLEKLSQATGDLTATELMILRLISKGYSNEDVSNELHYSYGYVKQLVSKIFEKLSISGRKEMKQFYR